jgi:hypothetical protein
MGFPMRWLKRRIVNKALFNYPRKVNSKYIVKSFVWSYLFSLIRRVR